MLQIKIRMRVSFTRSLFFSLFILLSCKHDEEIATVITASDFSVTMDENPALQEEIGKIKATTNQGTLKYEITSQSITGAIDVNPSTGELSVANAELYNYESNPVISGVAKISNGNVSKEIQIKISLRDVLEAAVSINDFTFSIKENPTNEMLIGKISGTTNVGNLTYSIESQSNNNALKIDAATGNLYVLTRSYFDFEINPVITAIVKASNNTISALSNIKIILKDLSSCDEENANMENHFADFVNTGNYFFLTTMDLPSHEYTFHVTEALNLCSVGYQSNTGKPCVIEIVDENNTILYSNIFTFSKTEQDYKSLPLINLQPNKNYTVRRRFENYNDTSDLIGKLFANKDYSSSVMPFNTGKITITRSKYYDSYNSNIVTSSIPFITLGYSLP